MSKHHLRTCLKTTSGVKDPECKLENGNDCPQIFDNLTGSEWFTADEAARYLRVSIGTLRNMTSNGTIRCFKLGRRARYRLDDLRCLHKPKSSGGSYGN